MSEISEMHGRIFHDIHTIEGAAEKEQNDELQAMLIGAELGLRKAMANLREYLKATK